MALVFCAPRHVVWVEIYSVFGSSSTDGNSLLCEAYPSWDDIELGLLTDTNYCSFSLSLSLFLLLLYSIHVPSPKQSQIQTLT